MEKFDGDVKAYKKRILGQAGQGGVVERQN